MPAPLVPELVEDDGVGEDPDGSDLHPATKTKTHDATMIQFTALCCLIWNAFRCISLTLSSTHVNRVVG